MRLGLGTYDMEEVDSTTADASTAAYSFTTTYGDVTGIAYKNHQFGDRLLPLVTVRLLRALSDPQLHAVMVDDPRFWEVKIAPYPPARPPFSQDFIMGYALRIRLLVNGVPTNGEGVTLKLVGSWTPPGEDSQVLEWEMLWPAAEHAGLIWDGGKEAYVPYGREFSLVTATVGEEGDGWVCEYGPTSGAYVIVPCGHGAFGQRATDYRDGSLETQQETGEIGCWLERIDAYYKGQRTEVALDGSVTEIDHKQAKLRIYGEWGTRVCHYHKGRPYPVSPTAWTESDTYIPEQGYADVELDAGEYSFAGYVYDGVLERYDYVTAGLVKIDLDWGGEYEITLKSLTASYKVGGGRPTVLAVRGGEAAEGVQTWWYEEWEGVWTWFYWDTADEEGLVEWEECFWDPDRDYGCWARFVGEPKFPIIALSQRVLVKTPASEPDSIAGVFCGHGPPYFNLPIPEPAAFIRQKPDHPASLLPEQFDHVRVLKERGSGKAVSEIPLPRWSMVELWPYWEQADYVVTWQLMGDEDTVLTEFESWTTQHFVVAGQILEDEVGSRLLGAAVADRTEEPTNWTTTFDAKRLGMEYGRDCPEGLMAIARPTDVSVELPTAVARVATQCSYCGGPAYRDPADLSKRGLCAQCDAAEMSHETDGYYETPPLGITSSRLPEAMITRYEMYFRWQPSDRLRPHWCIRRGHWRGECYWQDDYHEQDKPTIDPAPRWYAHHINFGDWDHAGGFTDGESIDSQAESEGPTGRKIGPMQPKLEVTEAFLVDQELRVKAARTDGSEMYFYGTLLAYPKHDVDDIVRFKWVLPNTTMDESDRRPLAWVYSCDGDELPCENGDVIADVLDVQARNPSTSEWESTASWLGQGAVKAVNDNPTYRAQQLQTRVKQWIQYLCHVLPMLPLWDPDLRRDYMGRVWLAVINESGTPSVYIIPHCLAPLGDERVVTQTGDYREPSVCPLPWGGALLAAHDVATGKGALFLSRDDGHTWEAVSMPIGDDLEKPVIMEMLGTGVIYCVGVDADVLYIEWSDDGGATKRQFRDSSTRKAITSLTFSGESTQASIETFEDGALEVAVSDDNGLQLWRSRDRGESWSEVT